jgi:hypothetical protein
MSRRRRPYGYGETVSLRDYWIYWRARLPSDRRVACIRLRRWIRH